jgi:hypothetical protein
MKTTRSVLNLGVLLLDKRRNLVTSLPGSCRLDSFITLCAFPDIIVNQ